MGETAVISRRSTRILSSIQNIRTPQKVAKRKNVVSKSAVKERRGSQAQPPKPILIQGARRGRSKSVSFDMRGTKDNNDVNENDFLARPTTNSIRRTLFSDSPIGTNQPPPAHDNANVSRPVAPGFDSASCAPGLSAGVAQEVAIDLSKTGACNQTVDPTSSSNDKIRGLENRIQSLVESNQLKINRIKLLMGERDSLMAQVDTLNRLNRSMTETLDGYREDESENRPPTNDDRIMQMDSQIGELKDEIQILRERIGRLNRANFQLEEENNRLKSVQRTYSSQVLAEHNYKM